MFWPSSFLIFDTSYSGQNTYYQGRSIDLNYEKKLPGLGRRNPDTGKINLGLGLFRNWGRVANRTKCGIADAVGAILHGKRASTTIYRASFPEIGVSSNYQGR